MKYPEINRLASGGVITNYYCSSKCAHCSVSSSPSWIKEFMTPDMAQRVLGTLSELGCSSIHVGGGEPLLNFESMLDFADRCRVMGVEIEYIESNSSWYQDEPSTISKLRKLMEAGVDTLLLSVSPFHNVYIPFDKVKGLMTACQKAGMRFFPWIGEYYERINGMGSNEKHSIEEYDSRFGTRFLDQMPQHWVGFSGRAGQFYKKRLPLTPAKDLLRNLGGCSKPYRTGHFHIDLFGNYLGCQGLAINIDDLGKPLSAEKYPLAVLLYNEGVSGLYEYATREFGYQPEQGYLDQCHLCIELRKFLSQEVERDFTELQPEGYYSMV